MLFGKITVLMLLVFFAENASADYLNCDLDLNRIDDSVSSIEKKLFLQIRIAEEQESQMNGSLDTISCFGSSSQDFHSFNTIVLKGKKGESSYGSVSDESVQIGSYHYQLKFELSKNTKRSGWCASRNIPVTGHLIPLDDEHFTYQEIVGFCHFSDRPENIFEFNDNTEKGESYHVINSNLGRSKSGESLPIHGEWNC